MEGVMAKNHYIKSTGEMVDLEELGRQCGLPPVNTRMELLLGTELRPVCPDCKREAKTLNRHGRCFLCQRRRWVYEHGPSADLLWLRRDEIALQREMESDQQEAVCERAAKGV